MAFFFRYLFCLDSLGHFTNLHHGRIIKWTQHIGILTLAVMERVVEGNYGNDLMEG